LACPGFAGDAVRRFGLAFVGFMWTTSKLSVDCRQFIAENSLALSGRTRSEFIEKTLTDAQDEFPTALLGLFPVMLLLSHQPPAKTTNAAALEVEELAHRVKGISPR